MSVRIHRLLWRVQTSTWLLLATLAVAFVGVWALYPLTFPVQLNSGHDFRLLYPAAQLMRAHQNPYDAATFLYRAIADGMPAGYIGSVNRLAQPYVYPPLFAEALIPFTFLSLHSALFVWRALSVVCVFVGTFGLLSLWVSAPGTRFFASRANRVLLAVLVACSPLSLYAAYWGNPVVLVYAAMGGWIWALHRGHARADVVAGILMTAALLKPQLAFPLAIIAVFCVVQGRGAWVRRLRVALGFGAALVVLAALDLLLTGSSLLLAWRRSVVSLSQMIFHQPDQPTLVGLLQPQLDHHSPQLQNLILTGIGLVGVAVGVVLYLRLRSIWTAGTLLALLTLVWCFASPYSHANDELFYVPGGVAAVSVLAVWCERFVANPTLRLAGVGMGMRVRTYARVGAPIIVTVLALVVLWFGGAIQLRYGTQVLQFPYRPGHILHLRLAAAIVPLAVLAAFIVDWRLHRRREDAGAQDDGQSMTAEQEMSLAPAAHG